MLSAQGCKNSFETWKCLAHLKPDVICCGSQTQFHHIS